MSPSFLGLPLGWSAGIYFRKPGRIDTMFEGIMKVPLKKSDVSGANVN